MVFKTLIKKRYYLMVYATSASGVDEWHSYDFAGGFLKKQ
jgi:hypothetical protein